MNIIFYRKYGLLGCDTVWYDTSILEDHLLHSEGGGNMVL
jgi:hypothetical protein